jgi:hypothetical protein
MVEAVKPSEKSINIYQTTQRNIPEECLLHTCHYENLKPNLYILFWPPQGSWRTPAVSLPLNFGSYKCICFCTDILNYLIKSCVFLNNNHRINLRHLTLSKVTTISTSKLEQQTWWYYSLGWVVPCETVGETQWASVRPGVGNLFMLEGRINLAVIK